MGGDRRRPATAKPTAQRQCAGCSSALAADNTAELCGRCHRDQRDQLDTPPLLRDDFWTTDKFRAAFESEHIGRVIKVYRNHDRHLRMYGKALSQEVIGRWFGLVQGQVSRLENGPPEQNLALLRNYSQILKIPRRFLWFKFPGQFTEPTQVNNLGGASRELSSAAAVTPHFIWSDSSDLLIGNLLGETAWGDPSESVPVIALASSIRETTSDLMAMDLKRGGGHTRRLLTRYFQDEVAPLLSWRYNDASLRSDIFSAAAETTQLLGWSAYDAGSHDTARRYFSQALRMAQEAGDIMMAGRILSNLSHQANFLARFGDALKFARQAHEITHGKATNKVASMFLSMEARALANLGDKSATLKLFHRAEQLHEASKAEDEPAWIGYFNSQELASEGAHCFRDLGDGGRCLEFAESSMDPRYTPPRTLGFMRLVSASGLLSSNEVEHAAELAFDAVELGLSLQSSRYIRYLTDFYAALVAKNLALGGKMQELMRTHYPTLILPS